MAFKEFDESQLMPGDVTVRVSHSTVNYKDGLAITGKSPVVRRHPMIPGIDFAGVVESSNSPLWKAGDRVILNGWGTGETHLGAYGQKSRVKGEWLVRLPDNMTTAQAMAVGTAGERCVYRVVWHPFEANLAMSAALRRSRHGECKIKLVHVIYLRCAGYTAMLCLMALEKQGLKPSQGPVVVTGAAGGVGSVAGERSRESQAIGNDFTAHPLLPSYCTYYCYAHTYTFA